LPQQVLPGHLQLTASFHDHIYGFVIFAKSPDGANLLFGRLYSLAIFCTTQAMITLRGIGWFLVS
jgi:hypothetical protein